MKLKENAKMKVTLHESGNSVSLQFRLTDDADAWEEDDTKVEITRLGFLHITANDMFVCT
jgi:hypothetical protein